MATKIAQAERELDVVLPDATHALPLISKPREVVINIDARGHFFVAAQPVTIGQLDQVLQAARVNNPSPRLGGDPGRQALPERIPRQGHGRLCEGQDT